MPRFVEARQDTFVERKLKGRSNSELRLTEFDLQPTGFHRQTLSWMDQTTPSFTNPAPIQRKSESPNGRDNSTVDTEATKFGRWWGVVRNRKITSGSIRGQNNSANTEHSRSDGAKISMWKKLLRKFKGKAQKIRPARSDTMTPPDSQPSHEWPRYESFRMPRPPKAFKFIKSMSLHSNLLSHVYLKEAAPLWKRRNVPQPPPLEPTSIKFNRKNRSKS